MTRAHADAAARALDRMTRPGPGPNDALVPTGRRPCPICGRTMRAWNDSGIVLDVCPEHGIWLDRGELEALLARPRRRRPAGVLDAVHEAGVGRGQRLIKCPIAIW